MKKNSSLFICLAVFFLASCCKQDVDICTDAPFSKVYGSSRDDGASAIISTLDEEYLFAGWTTGNDGDVQGNHGREDAWVVKLNCNGGIKWQKTFGGSSSDAASDIISTPDRGYVLAGLSYSIDGDITSNNGSSDAWIIKLDMNGNKVWQKTYGEARGDEASSIVAAPGGGYVALINSDADVTGHNGDADVWVIKIDNNGNQSWRTVWGGSSFDLGKKITATADGGYIFVGSSRSNAIDDQAWAVKLDANGNELWNKKLGGTKNDEFSDIINSSDGGYVLAGLTNSNDGDVSGKHGGSETSDQWIVKLNGSGSIVWQKALGGSGSEQARSIVRSPGGGYTIAGNANSNDGDLSGNAGSGLDGWVISVDGNGNKIWQKIFGGTGTLGDGFSSIIEIPGQGYAIAGGTYSNDGNISGNHGALDAWVLTIKNP